MATEPDREGNKLEGSLIDDPSPSGCRERSSEEPISRPTEAATEVGVGHSQSHLSKLGGEERNFEH